METPNYFHETSILPFEARSPHDDFYAYPALAQAPSQEEWACPQCTLRNPIHASICAACSFLKLEPGLSSSTAIVPRDPEKSAPETEYLNYDYTVQAVDYPDEDEANVLVQDIPEEDPSAKKRRRRRRRRLRMAAGVATGGLVGLVAGPLGVVIGGVTGGVVARVVSKRGEKRKDRRVAERRILQGTVSQ